MFDWLSVNRANMIGAAITDVLAVAFLVPLLSGENDDTNVWTLLGAFFPYAVPDLLFFHWPFLLGDKILWLRNFLGFVGFNVCMTLTVVVLVLRNFISLFLFEIYQLMLLTTILVYMYLCF